MTDSPTDVEGALRQVFSQEPLPVALATWDPGRAATPPARGIPRSLRLAPLALALAIAVVVGGVGAAVGVRVHGGDAGSGTSLPSARSLAAMAFDAERGVTVLFGGRAPDGTSLSDTWTWDGSAWTLMHPASSPSPRYAGTLVDDVAHHRVLLLGGTDLQASPGLDPLRLASEVWSWDGASWSRLPVAASETLPGGAAVWDGLRGEVIWMDQASVVDGVMANLCDHATTARPQACAAAPARAFTGTAWTPLPSVPVDGSGGRVQLATDPATHRPLALIVDPPCAGGCGGWTGYAPTTGPTSGSTPLAAHLFRLDADGWTRLPQDLVLTLESAQGASFVDAGRLGAVLVESGGAVASFDGTAWHTHAAGSPAPAFLATARSAAGDPVRGQVVLQGGGRGSSETWTWDGAGWTLRGGATPAPPPTATPSPAPSRVWAPPPSDLPACDVGPGAWGHTSGAGTFEVQITRSGACRLQGTLTVDAFVNLNATATPSPGAVAPLPAPGAKVASVTVPIDIELPLTAAQPERVTVASMRLAGCSQPGYDILGSLTPAGAAPSHASSGGPIARSQCDPGSELRIEVTPARGALQQAAAASTDVVAIGEPWTTPLSTGCGGDTIVIGSATFVASDVRWPSSAIADVSVVVVDPQHATVTLNGTAYRFVRTDQRRQAPSCP